MIVENAKFTPTSLRAEGEAIQFGYPLLALCWIATELSLLAMTKETWVYIQVSSKCKVIPIVFRNGTRHGAVKCAECMSNT